MTLNQPADGNPSLSRIAMNGLGMGAAGGLAEVVVVATYAAITNASVADVGRHVAAAAGFAGASAWTGLAVHMALSALLGIALMTGWCVIRRNIANATSPYLTSPSVFATVTLAGIWAINFFVVLPIVSPDFVTQLPYSVTLFSKLMFGVASAACLNRGSGWQSGRDVADRAAGVAERYEARDPHGVRPEFEA